MSHAHKLLESMRAGALKRLRNELEYPRQAVAGKDAATKLPSAQAGKLSDFRCRDNKDTIHKEYRVFTSEESDQLLKTHLNLIKDFVKP